jgi:hypothetical protein
LNRELQRVRDIERSGSSSIDGEEEEHALPVEKGSHKGTTLHQASVVRWLSLSDLLESVQKAYTSLVLLLNSSKQGTRIQSINPELVGKLVHFLNPWKIVLSELQCSNAPSLHTVLPCINYLRTELETGEKKEKGGGMSFSLSSTTR